MLFQSSLLSGDIPARTDDVGGTVREEDVISDSRPNSNDEDGIPAEAREFRRLTEGGGQMGAGSAGTAEDQQAEWKESNWK